MLIGSVHVDYTTVEGLDQPEAVLKELTSHNHIHRQCLYLMNLNMLETVCKWAAWTVGGLCGLCSWAVGGL